MNKKFSTLVASVLLASSIGTVNAGVISGDFAKYKTVPDAATVVKAGTYYQLATETSGEVIAMIPNSKDAYTLNAVKADGKTDVRYTLWTIDVQGNPTDGYRYTFVNLGANMFLSVDPATALKKTNNAAAATEIKGDVAVWKWQDAPDPVGGFSTTAVLTSVFGAKNDSTVTLVKGSKGVYAVKYALNNKTAAELGTSQIKLFPADPKAVVLGVDDLNSMLWTSPKDGKVKLTFDKDVEGGDPAAVNLFTKQAYRAVTPVGFPANYTSVAEFVETGKKWKLAYTKDKNPKDAGELDEFYTKMFEAEEAYCNAKSKSDFATTIEAILDLDNWDEGELVYSPALKAVVGKVKTEVTNKGTEAAILEAINKIDPKTVTANGVKSEVIEYVLSSYKKAMATAFAGHGPNQGYGKVEQIDLQAEKIFDSLIEISEAINDAGEEYAYKVEEYVDDADKAEDAKDKAFRKAKKEFEKGAQAYGWVSLQANYDEADEEPSYLAVDTSFLTSKAGDKHLAFAIKNFKDKNVRPGREDRTRLDLNGRFNFQFVWHPASDSIVIRTAGFAKKEDKTPYWSMMEKATNPTDLGMWKANIAGAGDKYERTDIVQVTDPFEQNLIKIAVLANNHREVTVGSSEFTSKDNVPISTINTRISVRNGSYKKTTIADGIYYFNLASNLPERNTINGRYIVAGFCGDRREFVNPEKDQTYGVAQNFEHMPRTQWVVEQNAGPVASERTINIYNREFPTLKAENLQLYEGDNGAVFALFGNSRIPFAINDTVSYKAVADPDAAKKGYMILEEEDLLKYYFTMNYYSGYSTGHKVDVSAIENDSVVFVNAKEDAEGVVLQLVKKEKAEKYGYKEKLLKQSYLIHVYDGSKLENNNKWIAWDEGTGSYVLSEKYDRALPFYLKENNELTIDGESKCYYSLVTGSNRAGVRDGSLALSIENACSEARVATFSLDVDNTPYYRRLGETNKEDGFEDMKTVNAKIYDAITGEYLYEDNNSDYSKGKGIHFLGIENKKVNVENPTLYIDTAYVRYETMMPQYLIAVGVKEYKAGKECPLDPDHNTEEYLAAHPDGCPHAVATQGYKVGRYLINFADSVELAKNSDDYQYDRAYTRLGFVEAKHIGDTLVIYRNGVPGTATADSIFLGDNLPNKLTWTLPSKNDPSKNTKVDTLYAAHKQGIKNAVFAFRLVDDQPEANFLIETQVEEPKATWGGWIKNQNGVPVVAHYSRYNEAALDALVFNIEPSSEEATDNETIVTAEVAVIAGEGQVTIANAAGKKVVVSNILGQTVANTVLTSDHAVIAAPQGVVVVAVEGEEAVKAIVK